MAHYPTEKRLRRGKHQFDLTAADAQFTNTVSCEFRVISVSQTLGLLKKSVRARLTARAQRNALTKLLSLAQAALAQHHVAAGYARLADFDALAQEILPADDPARQNWLGVSRHIQHGF